MATIRNQVINAFATKINAVRSLGFVDGIDLPLRSVWDSEESAEKTQYGNHEVEMPLQVHVILKAEAGQVEGDLRDEALGQLQTDVFTYDPIFNDLITGLAYIGAQFSYSQDGDSVIGLSAGFLIKYQFLTTNPNEQGA